MRPKKVALLTAGGLAPCLNAAVAGLIERYTKNAPDIALICYRGGYKSLLLGDSIAVNAEQRAAAGVLRRHGGSAIGNSRVKQGLPQARAVLPFVRSPLGPNEAGVPQDLWEMGQNREISPCRSSWGRPRLGGA